MPSEHEIEIDWTDLDLNPEPPAQPVRIEVGTTNNQESNDALVAALRSLSERQDAADDRQAELLAVVRELAGMVNTDREYLVASMDALAAAIREQPAPIVNVPPFPEFPQFPDIPAPVVTVTPPEVNVTVESPKGRQIKIERDPITQMISSAAWEDMD